MTCANLLRALALWLLLGLPVLAWVGLWSSAGYALIDATALAYAARWAA